MAKRLFDIAASVLGLIILLPILVVIGFAIRLDSPGGAVFSQERVGCGGRRFKLLKFRSMCASGVSGPQITVVGDARITRVGRFIRRTKLDELPQLLNVLRGEMSLVGPRPEVPKFVALYPPAVRNLVLSVRPGITDEAAIEFADESRLLGEAADPEAVYVNEILPRKLVMYESYARNRSFVGDLRILARTLVLPLRRS